MTAVRAPQAQRARPGLPAGDGRHAAPARRGCIRAARMGGVRSPASRRGDGWRAAPARGECIRAQRRGGVPEPDVEELVRGVRGADRRAIARAITLVESSAPITSRPRPISWNVWDVPRAMPRGMTQAMRCASGCRRARGRKVDVHRVLRHAPPQSRPQAGGARRRPVLRRDRRLDSRRPRHEWNASRSTRARTSVRRPPARRSRRCTAHAGDDSSRGGGGIRCRRRRDGRAWGSPKPRSPR